MWFGVKSAWQDVWWALKDALWTTAGALVGKRTHGGKVVTLGSTKWFPANMKRGRKSAQEGKG